MTDKPTAERPPESLQPHPKNNEIYGDRELTDETDKSFIQSIQENGVLTPILIDTDDRIISGHRRVQAAKRAGLSTVPVTVQAFDSDLERLETLIHSNRQRSKTVSQKLREAEAIKAIEQKRAKQRQGTRTDTSCSDEQEVDTGLTRDRVAYRVGFGSGTSYHRATTVREATNSDSDAVATIAQQQLEKLDNEQQSITGAHAAVKDIQQQVNRSQSESPDETGSTSTGSPTDSQTLLIQGDAGNLPLPDGSVDILITSPPYNLGHAEWDMGWRSPRQNGIGFHDDRPEDEYQRWQHQLLNEWYRVATDGASLFYVHKPRTKNGDTTHPVEWLRSSENPWLLRQEIVWNRKSTHNQEPTLFRPVDARVYWLTNGTPSLPESGIDCDSVWDIHGPRPDTDHPAPFPPEIPERCLETTGVEGDVILDPMAGSATTCQVASDHGYTAIGVEKKRQFLSKY
jgi:hypothetical protein